MNWENKPRERESGPAPDPSPPTHYVGVGASAGGLEAIEAFFTNMPADSGLAFIVVQHLSPDYKSLMVELLSKKTEMTVLRAENGAMVERNRVYLIPPQKNLTIFHGKLLLGEQDIPRGLNLPIDIFFRSLAEDQGEKAVGIILSGTGSDGMRGTRSIKENGGMIMVQDEETAKFDGMPRAAASTGLVDFILAPEDMPEQLLAFARHPYIAQTDRSEALLSDEDGLTRIFALLREKSKVDFTYYKPSTVTRRIERRMSVNRFEDIREYVEFLQNHPGEIMALYRELLIGVTRFFRDQEAFNQLSEKWLPELLLQKDNREIRFWAAGCSTGEEAYTLAIVIRECLERLGKSLDVKIFSTDVDKDAILRAGAGVYPASIAADLSPKLLAKYFHHKDDNFQIARNIREMVVFAQHNLIKDPPFTNIDLISCRNLLIYLQPVLQKRVMDLLNFSLNPGGLLMLGTSETVGDMAQHFEPLSQKYKIFKSTGRLKPGLDRQELLAVSDRKTREHIARHSVPHRGYRAVDQDKTLERFLDVITGDHFHLALIVNDQMEVLHVFGDTTGYFKVPSGRISNDISKMAAKDLSIPLTTGIQKVFRADEELRFSNINLRHTDGAKNVHLRIKPLPRKKGQEPLVAVFLNEVLRDKCEEEAASATYDLNQEAEQRIKDLEQELQFTKENLQATIEELETANEELQATNQELLASNEELQSTNEELQSTNEELHTVNAEYQNKIIELTELNNDVENLLSGAQIGTVLLDENLEVRKFSPQITNILKILDHDIGRPITHVHHNLTGPDIFEIIHRVLSTSVQEQVQVRSEDNRWYLMRVTPYAIGPQKFSGIVVSFVDITRIKDTQEALAKSEALLKRTARLAQMGSWEYDVAAGRHEWSEETFRIHELEPGRQPTPEEGINYYAPESRPVITEAFQKACRQGEPYDLVLEIITAQGNRRWVRAIGHPQLNDGRVEKVSGAFQDITQIREISDALSESEKRYQDLFATMNEGFALHEIITDSQGNPVDYRFLDVNPAFEDLTGLRSVDILGRRVLELLPQTEDYWIRRYGRVALTGQPDYFESYSGELNRWYSVAAYRTGPKKFGVLFSDITERKALEDELRRREEKFRSLFETMAQGVVYQDAEGRITEANPAAQEILGLTLDQMQGRTSLDPRWRAVHEDGSDYPGDTHPAVVALRTGRAVENAVMGVFNPADDQTRWISINAVPQFRNDEDRPYQVYAVFENITARFHAEKALKTAKDRLDLAFDSAGLAWWDWDITADRLEIGADRHGRFGREPGPSGGTFEAWLDLVHPDDRDRVAAAIRSHLDGRTERYNVKHRLRDGAGDYHWVRVLGMIANRDHQGRPARLIGAMHDAEPDPEGC